MTSCGTGTEFTGARGVLVESVTFANAVDRACIELLLGTMEQTEGLTSEGE
jgi:hypothetical protein